MIQGTFIKINPFNLRGLFFELCYQDHFSIAAGTGFSNKYL